MYEYDSKEEGEYHSIEMREQGFMLIEYGYHPNYLGEMVFYIKYNQY